MSDSLKPVIKLENAAKIYRRSHLGRTYESMGVDGINLEVRAGEVFGLLGLNGSGKTTTIKMLLGLLRPTRGAVEILGRRMPDLEVLGRVGYLPEAAYLNRFLTGRETVVLMAALSGLGAAGRKARVDEMLERVGMAGWADRRIGEYSKGMVQRIALAQALIHEPELLVLDEPISGLDPLAIHEMRQMILWLKAKGKTILLSSHDISEVEQVCDRVGILSRGRLARLADRSEWSGRPGTLEDLFNSCVERSERVGALKFS